MTKPNNPYARPINATKEGAMTVGEFYGTRATDQVLTHAGGKRDTSPASRYQAVGNADPTVKPSPPPKAKRPYHVRDKEPETAVTAEDLFG
jgi:hypothetical protein